MWRWIFEMIDDYVGKEQSFLRRGDLILFFLACSKGGRERRYQKSNKRIAIKVSIHGNSIMRRLTTQPMQLRSNKQTPDLSDGKVFGKAEKKTIKLTSHR